MILAKSIGITAFAGYMIATFVEVNTDRKSVKRTWESVSKICCIVFTTTAVITSAVIMCVSLGI